MMNFELLCPNCPLCGQPPYAVFGGGTQALCSNDGCTAWAWDPSRSLDDNLLNASRVEITETPLPAPGPDMERGEQR